MIELKTPCTSEDIEKLKCGDVVKISGVLYTGRDQAHKRMVAALKEGKELPFDVCGQAIYYVGPAPNKPAFRRWYSRLTNQPAARLTPCRPPCAPYWQTAAANNTARDRKSVV